MAVTTDILRSWVRPGVVVRRLLAAPQREGRALSFLVLGCLLIFVAQGPRLMRAVAEGAPGPDGAPASLIMLMSYELFAWLIIWPLAFYALAAVIHAVARILRGHGVGYDTRVALFWAVLASAPGALFYGLVMGFIGWGAQAAFCGALWISAFVVIAGAGLREAHRDG